MVCNGPAGGCANVWAPGGCGGNFDGAGRLGLALISRFFLLNFGPFSRKIFSRNLAKFSPFFLGLTKF